MRQTQTLVRIKTEQKKFYKKAKTKKQSKQMNVKKVQTKNRKKKKSNKQKIVV